MEDDIRVGGSHRDPRTHATVCLPPDTPATRSVGATSLDPAKPLAIRSLAIAGRLPRDVHDVVTKLGPAGLRRSNTVPGALMSRPDVCEH